MHDTKYNSKKIMTRLITALGLVVLIIFSSCKSAPWGSAMLIRYAFTKDAKKTNDNLLKFVPKDVSEILNVSYDLNDETAKLDVYYPTKITKNLPVVVWIHGGGWVSGNKSQSSNYYKILSDKGFVVVAVDYSIAPEKNYPLPVKQIMAALGYLKENSERFHINSSSFFLGGDSAGSHIASQVANIISSENYAQIMQISPTITRKDLKGLILYCGAYDATKISLTGEFGGFLKTVLWSYSGKKDFMTDPEFQTASVINYLDKNFPPSFISAGNGDPLLPQSESLAEKLKILNVKTKILFYPENYTPKLPHEYQFNLDTDAGKSALSLSVEFLKNNQ